MSDFAVEKERLYQNRLVRMLGDPAGLGYAYLGNWQYAEGQSARADGAVNGPVLEDELRAFLAPRCTPMQVDEAVREVRAKSVLPLAKMADLLECNAAFYELLMNGVKARPAPGRTEEDVALFDFAHPLENRFAFAEEVSYVDPQTGRHSRPDLVVYVNGIALAVVELKRATVTIEEGVRQCLSNERDLIPSFFTTVQFTVAANEKADAAKSDATGFKYGTVGTPLRFWCNWKDDHQKPDTQLTDAASFAKFFDKETFLFLFRYGVICDGGVKKVMRPHQYHALRACEPRLRAKASGVIWHSQGSGKSLTMVWLASYIRRNFPDPRVLVITDRTELDEQIERNFNHTATPIARATSKDDLLARLNAGTDWLVCSLIHKFGVHPDTDARDRSEVKIPLDRYLDELKAIIRAKYKDGFRVKGRNVFVFIDECHRTQGGSLHAAMREIMGQDVMLVGFTGTPLLRDDKKTGYAAIRNATQTRFGDFIHTYLNKEAVDDGVILDLQYEARDVEQSISDKAKLDERFAALVRDAPPGREQEVRDRWATLEKVYSASDRIDRIGYSILDDLKSGALLSQDWCNAMLVADSIYSAYKYYEFFQCRSSDAALKDRCAVVTSFSASDNDLRKQVNDPHVENELKFKHDMALRSFDDLGVRSADEYEAKAKDRFVHAPAQMKLLIVVDKLLTGFDAPTATILYVDRDMRDHTLFQAVCRVNRLGTDVRDANGAVLARTQKQFGRVVDFKHLFDKLEDAITRFNSGAFENFDPKDVEGLLSDAVQANARRLRAARAAWQNLRSDWLAKGLSTKEDLAAYYKTDFPPDDPAPLRRQMMYKIAQNYVVAYANLADDFPRADFSPDERNAIYAEVSEARKLSLFVQMNTEDFFDVSKYDPQMRSLLDRFVRADEAEVIVPATADFSFLDLLGDLSDDEAAAKATAAAGSGKSAAEVVEAKARSVINSFRDQDPAAYAKFSEQLQSVIDEIRDNALSFEEKIRKLLDVIRRARAGEGRYPPGVSSRAARALWNNRAAWLGPDADTRDEADVARDVLEAERLAEFEAGASWKDPSSKDEWLFRETLADSFPSLSDEQVYNLYKLLAQNV